MSSGTGSLSTDSDANTRAQELIPPAQELHAPAQEWYAPASPAGCILEDILGGRNLEETVRNQLCAHLAQLDLLEPEELIALVEFLSKRKLMKLRATHAPGERTAPADPTDVVSASSGGPRESSAHPELIEAVRSSPTTRPTETEVCK